ncbi:tail component of prophage CP-933R [Escherichia coli]|nr:tail component of prophage CP-933R [Escherichia coli]
MLTLSRAGQAAGLTFNQAGESLAALVNAGVRGGEQFDAINQSVARFASASGVEVDKVAEAFGTDHRPDVGTDGDGAPVP